MDPGAAAGELRPASASLYRFSFKKHERTMKHLIIGGVAGGATAAARIRRADESAAIVVLEKGSHISYANCGLPYYIGGRIAHRNRLLLHTPESFSRMFNIDVRVRHTALAIDTERQIVLVERPDGSRYEEAYDRLLLSPGASAVRPPLPGIDHERIFTLRTVADTDRIKSCIDDEGVRRAVVVGGGFVGLEMVENLRLAGLDVALVEMGSQVLAPLDFAMASFVHRELMEQGIDLYLEHAVSRFEAADAGLRVVLADETVLETDLVILAIGVRPETELARAAGLAMGERGIRVDEHLQTSAPNVYAVGDAIEFPHPITGEPWLSLLAGPANRQARLAADNMVFGNVARYEGSIGTAIAKVFDLAVACTGLSEKELRRRGMPHRTSTTLSPHHAAYYPEAHSLIIQLTFDPQTGRLFGAQCVGHQGVDKRIDLLAAFIRQGATVEQLTTLEHAYAPPFSSAKDPVAIAGYVATNIVRGAMPNITWQEVAHLDAQRDFLLDVRTPAEVKNGSIEGAAHIPLDQLRDRLAELPRQRRIVVACAVGLRGYLALNILRGNGFSDVVNLSGGYVLYAIATQETGRHAYLRHLHYPQHRPAQPWRSCVTAD